MKRQIIVLLLVAKGKNSGTIGKIKKGRNVNLLPSFIKIDHNLQVNIIRIDEQLQKFVEYQRKLSSHIGTEKAKELVNKGLVLITIGGNDFVNNYYLLPYSVRSREFSLPDYVNYLISEYKKILAVRA